jgi:hypothetical protein
MTDVHDLVVRLREEGNRMAPDSPAKLLLREAASTIERLDEALRRHISDSGRLALQRAQGTP